MEPTTRLQARLSENSHSPQSLIVQCDDKSVMLKGRGNSLDAQFVTKDGHFVVFSGDADPGEAALYISLLTKSLEELEFVTLAQDYTDGILKNIAVDDSGDIQFEFFNGVCHCLHFSSSPRLAIRSLVEVSSSKNVLQRKHLEVSRSTSRG